MTVFTTAGKNWVVDKMQNVAPSSNAMMTFTAWGTGGGAESVGNTALTTEASEARVASTQSQPSADTDRLVGTITANGTKSIQECGRFNQSAVGGVMLMRSLFTAIPMLANDRIEFTQDLQVT